MHCSFKGHDQRLSAYFFPAAGASRLTFAT
jgi:hypothetical protein